MLFNNSPVKNVSEKLKSPQTSIKNIKFERKKDFKSFLSYIEREAKALDAIQLPRRNEIQKKKRSGLGAVLGFGALGLLGLFGGAGSDSKRNDYKYIDEGGKSGIDLGPMGRRQEGESDSDSSDIKKDSPITPTDIKNFAKNNFDVMSDVTRAASYAVNKKYNKQIELEKKKEINNEAKKEASKDKTRSKRKFFKSEKEIGGNTTKKISTATIDNNQGKQGPTGGTRGRVRGGSGYGGGDNIQKYYMDVDGTFTTNYDDLSDQAKFYKDAASSKFDPLPEVPKAIKREISNINRRLQRTRNPEIQKELLNRLDQINKNIEEIKKSTATSGGKSKGNTPVKVKPKRGSGLFSRLPFSSTLSKSLSKPALFSKPVKLLKAIRKSGLVKGVKAYAPGKLKTVLFGVDLALTGSAEMDSISKISLRNNIVTALFDLLGPSSTVNRMAEIFNQPGLLIPKVYQGQEGTYIYRDNKIINENIRKIKESNKKDFTRSDIYKGVTGNAEILNRIMHGKKQTPKIETIPKIRSIDKYDFSDDDSGVNIFTDLQELKGRK